MVKNYSGIRYLFIALIPFLSLAVKAQNLGNFSGNFEFNTQFYQEDSLIGAEKPEETALSNGFFNLLYNRDRISAGIRYEAYLNPLLGYPPGFKGQGIPYRFASYRGDEFQITVGNFYEQFGSGMILRAYNSPGLGYDNAFDGFRLQFQPHPAVNLKVLWGKQRNFFDLTEGIVRAADADIVLNQLLYPNKETRHSLVIGGSIVSKYQPDDRSDLVLPTNVAAFGGRMQYNNGGVVLQGEYVYKSNDPSIDNGFIYHDGQGLLASASYSTRGFGITYGIKAVDNMSFRSDRDLQGTQAFINYIPALNRQHTYNLAASFYPYAVQPLGEAGHQLEILYTFPRKTPLGGKYGTYLTFNWSEVYALQKDELNPNTDLQRLGYRSKLMPGNERYFRDYNFELRKRINKDWNLIYNYVNLFYNMEIVQGLGGKEDVFADIHIADIQYKITKKKALRLELQHMHTEQDMGSWASAILEYTVSPHWFFSVFDQYNYGNKDQDLRIHYLIGSVGYIKDAFRITANYGKQRAGIFCVGGICRNVPASSGLSISVTGTF